MMSLFKMPIIGTADAVVFKATAADDKRAQLNHGGQSLQRLAERGGVDWAELRAILADEDYTAMPERRAARACHLILQDRA